MRLSGSLLVHTIAALVGCGEPGVFGGGATQDDDARERRSIHADSAGDAAQQDSASESAAILPTEGDSDGGIGEGDYVLDGATPFDAAPPIDAASTARCVGTLCGAVTLHVGPWHACVVRTDRSVWCWGANFAGQLGRGTIAATGAVDTIAHGTAAPVVGLTDVAHVSLGSQHTCALRKNGSIACFGSNQFGQLGLNQDAGSSTMGVLVTPTPFAGTVVEIVAGGVATCARLAGGGLRCWGALPNHSPGTVIYAGGVDSLTIGSFAMCFSNQGAVRCVGSNANGQLGNPALAWSTSFSTTAPASLSGLVDELASAISVHCAHVVGKGFECWGPNVYDEIATGMGPIVSTPIAIGFPSPVEVASGGTHMCARNAAGEVYCRGNNAEGQCGAGSALVSSPIKVPLPKKATRIGVGGIHSCALLEDQSVWCWGKNNERVLGRGDGLAVTASSGTPAPVMVD